MRRMRLAPVLMLAMLAGTMGRAAHAQGQDSTPAERDAMVIHTLLQGVFANTNQSYFDRRANRTPQHRAHELEVKEAGGDALLVSGRWDGEDTAARPAFEWRVRVVDNAVRMRVTPRAVRDGTSNPARVCELAWAREAEQFRALPVGDCENPPITGMLLGPRQLWITYAGDDALTYQLHRARRFRCYADVPGVGGGRDEPYERYGEFELHDQGGNAWFTTTDGRELGISLLNVDWPINNYEGAFARDSLVVYVSERSDDGNVEHGYAFTLPEADRIGINLKWLLAMCYITSNRDIEPFM